MDSRNEEKWKSKIILNRKYVDITRVFFGRFSIHFIIFVSLVISVFAFYHYYINGLGLAYNDARSHLDIGRRVVEGLNTGFAQLGSVWLPLTHLLMVTTIWNDFMWHSGLAGAMWSMISFVAIGILIYLYLRELGSGLLGRFVGVSIFVTNLNVLYLQSTAMTELVLLLMMTMGAYYLLRWFKTENLLYLIYSAFFIMLASLVRYDGWFMFFFTSILVSMYIYRKYGYWHAEGMFVLFCTLAGFGVFLWLFWNSLIFKDPLYFAFGPYSAHSQQDFLAGAGELPTKWNLFYSTKVYIYAFVYNTGAFTAILGLIGMITLWSDRFIKSTIRQASTVLFAPLIFNILALYLGHSVLNVEGLSSDTWFNIRYGMMMMPSIAIFVGYLVHRVVGLRTVFVGLLLFVTFFQFTSSDAVTVDDARHGSSQKDVKEISQVLSNLVKNSNDLILISSDSHDAIIFSSGLPMKRFIHEGSGVFYDSAIKNPDYWVHWIVMKKDSDLDSTWRLIHDNPGFQKYDLVGQDVFADIYQLRAEYLHELNTDAILNPKLPTNKR